MTQALADVQVVVHAHDVEEDVDVVDEAVAAAGALQPSQASILTYWSWPASVACVT